MNIDQKYLAFLNKSVKLNVTEKEYNGRTYKIYTVDEQDLIYKQLIALLVSEHTKYRIMLPGTVGTCDFNLSRVNFNIDESGKIVNITKG